MVRKVGIYNLLPDIFIRLGGGLDKIFNESRILIVGCIC